VAGHPNWAWATLNFFFFLNYGGILRKKKKKKERKKKKEEEVRMVKLQQFGTLGGSSVTF
jgi:hypothetical protein